MSSGAEAGLQPFPALCFRNPCRCPLSICVPGPRFGDHEEPGGAGTRQAPPLPMLLQRNPRWGNVRDWKQPSTVRDGADQMWWSGSCWAMVHNAGGPKFHDKSFESHSGSSAAFHPAGLALATWVVSGKAPGSSGLSEPPALCSIAQQGPDHHI